MTKKNPILTRAAAPAAIALMAAAAPAMAQQQANPIPDINLALVFDGREAAADTTDEKGYAEFPAAGVGDHGITLQEPVPVEAALSVLVEDEEWSVLLAPGMGPQPAIEIPVEHEGDMVMVRLESLDPDWTAPEPEYEPVVERPEAPIDVPSHEEVTRANAPDADNAPPVVPEP